MILTSTNNDLVYLVENPEGYVAYSKAATVTVSKAAVQGTLLSVDSLG